MAIKHLKQRELADRWNISPRTLERWRWVGEGPHFIKIGGRVVYRLEDVEAYAALTRRTDTLCVVDAVSSLGAVPCPMDAWGIDLVVSASQKAWMASPGIAIAALGERAWAATEVARMPRYYWDFTEARRWAGKGQTPWTPAIAVLYGLRVGVARLRDEGRERTWARHAAIARAVAAGLDAIGLRLVAAPADRSATVTAAWVPDGVEWAPFNAAMRARGLVLAGGQGKWAGRILRFGHMGEVGIEEMARALELMAATLLEVGIAADGATSAATARETFDAAVAAAR